MKKKKKKKKKKKSVLAGGEEFLAFNRRRLDGLLARNPVGGAHLTVCFVILNGLVDASAHKSKGRGMNKEQGTEEEEKESTTRTKGNQPNLENPENLVDASAHRHIVDGNVLEDPVRRDDEESAQSHSLLLNQHIVVPGDLEGPVRQKRELDLADSSHAAGHVDPRQVRVCRIGGDSKHAGTQLLELSLAV